MRVKFCKLVSRIFCYFSEPPPPKAPLVLTSDQFAQLAQNGVFKLATTTTASQFTSTALTSTTTSPVVIKSEPCPLSLGGTPTVQTISQNNFSHEDVSLNFNYFCQVTALLILNIKIVFTDESTEKATENDQKQRICMLESKKEKRIRN